MDRRTFILGAFALAGCAQTRPSGAASGPAQPGAPTTPSASAAPSPTARSVVVGGDQTATGVVLTALLSAAVAGSGSATTGSGWRAALGDRSISAVPVYAATAWAQLSDSDEPSDDVVGDLAGLVRPDAEIMAAGKLDGGLVWMDPATSAVKSLAHVAKSFAGRTVAVPSLAVERSDGLPGLSVIYRAKVRHVVEDDPVARAALVTSGTAAFGAFRRTEYLGTDALRDLADPSGMAAVDPVVLAVNAAFADADPTSVLALNAVIQALTDTDLVGLQQQVAGGSPAADVAHQWLLGKGLVK
jgi:glycine betaine/choline ABC-type transport system substrate-binding protein